MKLTLGNAVAAIRDAGVCLVFPLANRKDVPSLWQTFYPRTPMRWEWTEDGDDRLPQLWRLREELARSHRVPYAKWFHDRATFFSKPAYEAALATLAPFQMRFAKEAEQIHEALRESSPQSTKEVKRSAGLEGKFFSSTYDRSLKHLWRRLAIVGVGERDDGAFPSLLLAAAELVFEDSWIAAQRLTPEEGRAKFAKIVSADSPFLKELDRFAR